MFYHKNSMAFLTVEFFEGNKLVFRGSCSENEDCISSYLKYVKENFTVSKTAVATGKTFLWNPKKLCYELERNYVL